METQKFRREIGETVWYHLFSLWGDLKDANTVEMVINTDKTIHDKQIEVRGRNGGEVPAGTLSTAQVKALVAKGPRGNVTLPTGHAVAGPHLCQAWERALSSAKLIPVAA